MLDRHAQVASDIVGNVKVLPYFYDYLKRGCYPFYKEVYGNRMTSMRYVLGHPGKYGFHPALKLADTNVGGGDGFITHPHYALGFLQNTVVEPSVPEVCFPEL